MATQYQMNIDAGDDFTATLTFTDSNGAPIDLTNRYLLVEIRKRKRRSEAPLLSLSPLSGGITISAPTLGVAVLSITRAQITASLNRQMAWHNVYLYAGDQNSTRQLELEGPVKINL